MLNVGHFQNYTFKILFFLVDIPKNYWQFIPSNGPPKITDQKLRTQNYGQKLIFALNGLVERLRRTTSFVFIFYDIARCHKFADH